MAVSPVYMAVADGPEILLPAVLVDNGVAATVVKEPPTLKEAEDHIDPVHGARHLDEEGEAVLHARERM